MNSYIEKLCPDWRKNILNIGMQIPLFNENFE